MKPRSVATKGSPNEFGWLFTVNVTSRGQATEILDEIPLRLKARAFSSLLARKKFDFAQDDRLTVVSDLSPRIFDIKFPLDTACYKMI